MASTAASQAPPPGSLPTAAQIPLESFELPTFPPQAQELRALTLTCDIALDNYTGLLTQPFKVTDLPPKIESLTLELFSLGYPAGFLEQLAQKLPELKSLTVFGQLLGGVSVETHQDVVKFFEMISKGLRELHLLDVFSPPGLIKDVGNVLQKQGKLMFSEINYTTRHDEDFFARIPGTELPGMVNPGLITFALNMAPSEGPEDDDEEDKDKGHDEKRQKTDEPKEEGITPLNRTLAEDLVQYLTAVTTRPRTLKVLNTTLYTLTFTQLRRIKEVHTGILVLNVTVELEMESSEEGDEAWNKWKAEVLESIAYCTNLEQVEIVASPGLQFSLAVQNPRRKILDRVWPGEEDMAKLKQKCPNLILFQGSILRKPGGLEWRYDDGKWTRGLLSSDGSQ
ncbi:hypothetical protein NA57DRAFT_70610 [Rhizodiscina lignyota]|uniref:Uncharacterized protein n=1 Tax=Rhizodiscina lignyota TaxID=1504668 RepID=A0A9P4IQU9_9PEZI|nr:hypothetical protein NA57DRAFT_70610 [Rhizodiscina lignyota]